MKRKRMKIFSYNPHSASAKALAEGLGIKRIRHNNSRYRYQEGDRIINWGATNPLEYAEGVYINDPQVVGLAADKLRTFRLYEGHNLMPPFTTDIEVARQWSRDGIAVVCRTILRGHSGRGIVIAETEQDLIPAPLYVQYIKKLDEYRVHIFQGDVIDVQRKARRVDVDNPNWQVRNHANGFVYQRNDIAPPPQVMENARAVMGMIGLHFGAVDVIWNAREERAYMLEINTAPGLVGTTLDNYIAAFRRLM
jgi:glutathione synthase/RimK-type ligase-like ATP-grasp enzyme